MTVLYTIAMAALALAAITTFALPRGGLLITAVGCALLVIVGVEAAIGGARPALDVGGWLGYGTSGLAADGLAGIFLALTGLTGAAVALAYTLCPGRRAAMWLTAVLILAVAVVIGADNAFELFLAWEGLTVCVYLLTSGEGSPRELASGYLTGGLAKIGGAALLAAIGLMYSHTHSFDLVVWTRASLSPGTQGVLFVLFLACFASKIGILPLQGGLPAGYSSASRLGAASLAVALCAGFYGLWRFELNILAPLPTWCGDMLLIVGAATALTGITYALTQDRMRSFLGYSTVENAGIILVGLGVAALGQAAHKPVLAAAGMLAATLHVCGHNLAKTLALIAVDRVETATGDTELDPLGGLAGRLPFTATSLGIASLTLAAIPPLGGFVSEWFTFQALLQGFRMPTLLSQLLCALAAATLALTAGLGLLAFAKFYSFIFLGRSRSTTDVKAREPTRWPGGLIAISIVLLFLGTVAPWEIHAIGSALQATLGMDLAATTISHPLVLTPVFVGFSVLDPTWLSVTLPVYVVLCLAVVRLTRGRSIRRAPVRRAPVWVTGSGAPLAAVQYRPSAYSNPMRYILRGPLGYRATTIPERTAADALSGRLLLQVRVTLVVDRFLYAPAAVLVSWLAQQVRGLQSGRLSVYLLYMLIALIVALSLVPILR
ncbi:MAG TPA: proton-conducting transporter membrane subunit [Solirubrobacteraceae bacterium]|nr:proton-conducting transporter membrane subunit [Solirubrobacteraceae bacterium]